MAAGLKTLSMAGLNELLEEIELTIKDYNDTLVHDLAQRDDLELEKVLCGRRLLLNILVLLMNLIHVQCIAADPMNFPSTRV